jgi:hypothetical protein
MKYKKLTPAERVEYCHDNAADEDDQPRNQQYVPALEECIKSQSTYIPREPQCQSPRWNWDPPTPSPPSEWVSPPLSQRRGGARSPAGEGGGRVPIRTTGETA